MRRKPTRAQLGLIRHFAGQRNDVRVNQETYRVCREQGWLKEIDEWPYHAVTDDGLEALR